jgi:putative transposase
VIKSDNRGLFIAKNVSEFLGFIGVSQEFTHMATQEENTHIEAYHRFLKKERLHGQLGRITPMEKWNADKHLILMNKLTN